MPRYLSQRKAAKYRPLIEKLARILASNKYDSILVEGPPSALYDDLWTIRSSLFSSHSSRFKFKKQFNGVWVEIVPKFDEGILSQIDVWDGETVEQEMTRGMIATKLIMDKPSKIRFVRSSLLSDKDFTKLESLAIGNNYEMIVDTSFISFTRNQTSQNDDEPAHSESNLSS